jgi:hypothetical protein
MKQRIKALFASSLLALNLIGMAMAGLLEDVVLEAPALVAGLDDLAMVVDDRLPVRWSASIRFMARLFRIEAETFFESAPLFR